MGRILAGVLLLAACGDNGIETPAPMPPGGVDTAQPGVVGDPIVQYTPQVCGELTWTTGATTGAIDIAVMPRVSGAQVLAVPVAGGAITGYTLSKQMNMQQVSPDLSFNSGFTTVSASLVGNRLTATGADASSLRVNVIADDLSQAQQVAKLLPGFIAKPAFQVADGINFMPIADAQGLRIEQFDGQWNATTTRVATTEPATGMTAARMGYTTVAAWSTASSCYMMTLFGAAPGSLLQIPEACTSPHLAIDQATERGALVFEGTDGIRWIMTEHTGVVGVSQLLTRGGTSPRVVWDGHRYWISHIDPRGDIIVGTLENGRYQSAEIAGVRPTSGAYELVLMNGSVWTVSFDDTSYQANRLCMLPTNG